MCRYIMVIIIILYPQSTLSSVEVPGHQGAVWSSIQLVMLYFVELKPQLLKYSTLSAHYINDKI